MSADLMKNVQNALNETEDDAFVGVLLQLWEMGDPAAS